MVAEEYVDGLVERERAAATIRKQRWYLLELAKPLHERPIGDVTPSEVLYLLKSIEKSGRRETARMMRGSISAVFRLAVETMRAETDPAAALKGALVRPEVVGRAAITDEMRFGALLRSFKDFTGWSVIIDAIKFQILTMTRPGDAGRQEQ